MAASLFNGAEGLIQNLLKIGQVVSEKIFKDFMILYMYIAQGQGQITRIT